MASVIKAGNATDGVQVTSDNTGILELKTGSGSGTTAVTVDTSQNVGIGTSSPATKLNIVDASATVNVQLQSGSVTGQYFASTSAGGVFLGSSSTHPLVFRTDTTERMRIDSSGNVGIGTSSPNAGLDVGGAAQFIWVGTKTASSGNAGNIRFRDDTGTTRWIAGVLGNAGATAFSIFDNVASSTRLNIDSSGNVLVTSAAGLGYGTGAGGTVTQGAGSGKATAVTLNKPTGQITMNNAALGANTTVSFNFTNSLISATDNIIVNLSGGVSNQNNYNIWAYPQAGFAAIQVRNISGGSLSESVLINFAIIKGATS